MESIFGNAQVIRVNSSMVNGEITLNVKMNRQKSNLATIKAHAGMYGCLEGTFSIRGVLNHKEFTHESDALHEVDKIICKKCREANLREMVHLVDEDTNEKSTALMQDIFGFMCEFIDKYELV